MPDKSFWHGKKVLLTGHTGFKGGWLSLWLSSMGAKVCGYALDPVSNPSIYEICNIKSVLEEEHIANILNLDQMQKAVRNFNPDLVFHLAAQSLVQESYKTPVETYQTNVMGTVNLLECVRNCETIKGVIIVTSDKCYENKEWVWGYRENDRLGGYDPYSNSKACAELVTKAYTQSFFASENSPAIASVRAGNVIGGGDWAENRLVPDCVRAFLAGDEVVLRNPNAVRPWQHVLEPLAGYLTLAEKLYQSGSSFNGGWNFGPDDDGIKNVGWIAETLAANWFSPSTCKIEQNEAFGHETNFLRLSSTKAMSSLNWKARWNISTSLTKIIDWTKAYSEEADMQEFSLKQITEYMNEQEN